MVFRKDRPSSPSLEVCSATASSAKVEQQLQGGGRTASYKSKLLVETRHLLSLQEISDQFQELSFWSLLNHSLNLPLKLDTLRVSPRVKRMFIEREWNSHFSAFSFPNH